MKGMTISNVRQGPAEMSKNVRGILATAAKNKISLSAQMELEDPSDQYTGDDAYIDAFSRTLRARGVVTRSIPELGLRSSSVQDMLDGGDANLRGLFAEYCQREYIAGKYGREYNTRFLLTSIADDVSAQARPYIDSAIYDEREELEISPLAEIIAVETPIEGRSYHAMRMDYDESDLHASPVNEGAEIPKSKIQLSEESFSLRKYGNSVEWTYEVDQQGGVEKVGFFIRQLARESEYDKLGEATAALMTSPGITSVNLSTLDPAAATGDVFTLKALLALVISFNRGHQPNTVLGQPGHIVDFLMTPMGGTNRALIEAERTPVGTLRKLGTPLNNDMAWDTVATAPANSLVFFDRNAALERLVSIGSTISEMESFITRQTRVMTFTEAEAFNVIRPTAIKIVVLNA